MKSIGYGLDLSHHQIPSSLPWESSYRGRVDFVICRASYGTMRDRQVEEHVRRARSIGAKVGLYFFFRPSQSADEQFNRLLEVAHAIKLGPGDIVPAIDIEADPIPKLAPVTPAWAPPCKTLVDRMVGTWGDAIVYITQREFGMLGRPSWVTERPLWCAHYSNVASPATPAGVPATIWQHRVGPFDPAGPGGAFKSPLELDQNRLLMPLPLIQAAPSVTQEEVDDLVRQRAIAAQTIDEEATRAVDAAFEKHWASDTWDESPEEDRLA